MFGDGLKTWLKNMLNTIGGGLDNDTLRMLTQSPSEYSPQAYALMRRIAMQAVQPIAVTVLAVVFSLEILRVAQRMDGDRELGVKSIISSLFKIIVVYMAAMHAEWLADGITQIVRLLGVSVNTIVGPASATGMKGLGDTLLANGGIDDSNTIQQLMAGVALFLPWILSNAMGVVVRILLLLRFVELFIMTSFGALPIAFLSYDGTRQWGEGYIRSFGSVAFSNVTLLIAVGAYRAVAKDMFHIDAARITLNQLVFHEWGSLLGMSLLMIGLLVISSKTSKALFGQG
ncbi:type IV secretion system protein [Corynebacterium matruchotii]|uniref:type IV secretion system protein n=1 Tax=Corynebacterium matruchotii TaxID=43768 RepID=UPI0028EDF5C3|nr:type IV secretion system protein [Corynebacterium matruchotii]